MSRTKLTSLVLTAAAVAVSVSAAHARPVFMKFDGVDGECTSGSDMSRTIVGGQSVVQWRTPNGTGTLVLTANTENASRPMESLSLNYTKIDFTTVPIGANVSVADDVWVDGRIITAAVWARWVKLTGNGVQIEFGKSAQIDGAIEVFVKRGGVPVGSHICAGASDLAACWFLVTTCPDLECSVLCPSLCGVPSTSRPDPAGGVAIDLPLAGLTTFAPPGQAPITGDEISVVLRPATSFPPAFLGGVRVAVGDINGLQFNTVRGEFGCPADINSSGSLTVQDIFDFLARFFGGSPVADFNHSGGLTVQDLFDFLAAYFRGC